MHEKPLVFRGDECIDNVRRHILILNKYASTLSDFFYKVSVAAEYAQRNLQRDIADGLCGWQARSDKVIGANDARNTRNGRYDDQPGDDD
jgi:hypothetical protein